MTRARVLLIINQCNPDWPSEPLEGYRWYEGLRERADVTLVTHVRNREALQRSGVSGRVFYIEEGVFIRRYYAAASRLATRRGAINWPLLHALSYPVYEAFNREVDRRFAPAVRRGEFDVVHAITPVLPRYPVRLSRACGAVPFVLGPVNGGLPFPPGFAAVAAREFAAYYFLRRWGWLLPGYRATYHRAAVLLGGSQHTADWLRRVFPAAAARVRLLHENGVSAEFFAAPRQQPAVADRFSLLFVGRLVPFKGCDIVIEAMARAAEPSLHLTVVGDGPERARLAELTAALGLSERVRFVGWLPQSETADHYRAADAFCFPSVREFGGAVVLEAMAAGLPCIVVDHGGIGEYVTAATGYKLPALSRGQLVGDVHEAIVRMMRDRTGWQRLSRGAFERARCFEWGRKCDEMTQLYASLLRAGTGCADAKPRTAPAASR